MHLARQWGRSSHAHHRMSYGIMYKINPVQSRTRPAPDKTRSHQGGSHHKISEPGESTPSGRASIAGRSARSRSRLRVPRHEPPSPARPLTDRRPSEPEENVCHSWCHYARVRALYKSSRSFILFSRVQHPNTHSAAQTTRIPIRGTRRSTTHTTHSLAPCR